VAGESARDKIFLVPILGAANCRAIIHLHNDFKLKTDRNFERLFCGACHFFPPGKFDLESRGDGKLPLISMGPNRVSENALSNRLFERQTVVFGALSRGRF
jgi:hypothetical protein